MNYFLFISLFILYNITPIISINNEMCSIKNNNNENTCSEKHDDSENDEFKKILDLPSFHIINCE